MVELETSFYNAIENKVYLEDRKKFIKEQMDIYMKSWRTDRGLQATQTLFTRIMEDYKKWKIKIEQP